jgi:hypothetical protein
MSAVTIIRGALLPFFFITTTLFADVSLSSHYEVFYMDIEQYDKWVNLERNDHFRDVFISAYNLPSRGRRKFSHKLDVKSMKSYSTDQEYAYIYIDAQSRTSFSIIISGIKKGEVSVNGSKRGNISVEKDTGYSTVSGVLEKGVYFLSIRIFERFEAIPLIALSDNRLTPSVRKGFNRDASAKVSVINFAGKGVDGIYSDMYKSFCFPYTESNDEKRTAYYFTVNKKHCEGSGLLIDVLSRPAKDKAAFEKLTKTGFSATQIIWWQESFFTREVCKYGESI